MKYNSAILACLAPALAAASGHEWKFKSAPSGGLDDVTFGFNIANAPHTSGFYFANQFRFKNLDSVGYCGVQPREDSNGKTYINAVFSSFAAGTTTSHPNCTPGADGGPGVSCALKYEADYTHTYNILVSNVGGTTWRGTLSDTTTRQTWVVGEWTLPSSTGKLENGEQGFVEYYNWNDGQTHDCHTLPYTEVTFMYPTSNTGGVSGGRITNVHEYGVCVGTDNFAYQELRKGVCIEKGF